MEIKQIVSSVLGSNTFIVENGDNVLIIDAGAELNKVLDVVENKKVCGILLTHLHFDHVYFLADYVEHFGCKVYLNDQKNVDNKNYTLSNMVGGINLPKNCYVDVAGKSYVDIENFNVKCYSTPGHSADSMCYVIEENLFSGDTLFDGTIGRTDLPTSSVKDMLSSLELLKTLTFKTCFSGHGENSNYDDQIENIKYFIMEL